jgi:hypothetical protein
MWHAFIPRDDYSTWSWDVQFAHNRTIDVEAQHQRRGLKLDKELKKQINLENEYAQDRELQKTGNFTGIRGIANQDHAATETMGPIVDRTIEHLGTSDLPVIHMRRILLQQVKAFQKGETPLVLDNPSLNSLYSDGLYDDNQKSWKDAFPMKEQFQLKKTVAKL